MEIDGRAVRVDISTGKPQTKKAEAPSSAPADTLFMGNLSFNATEDSVRELFSEHGEITSVRLPTDRESGQPKGYYIFTCIFCLLILQIFRFGYISFASVDEAKSALNALNGSPLDGRNIRLDYATPKSDDNGGGGRGGRGGFRGGRGGFGGGRGGNRGGFGGNRGGRGGNRGGRGGFGNRGGFSAQPSGTKITF
jgi:nucleolin